MIVRHHLSPNPLVCSTGSHAGHSSERVPQGMHGLPRFTHVSSQRRVHMSSVSQPSPTLNLLHLSTSLRYTLPPPTSSTSSKSVGSINISLHFHGYQAANLRAWCSPSRLLTLRRSIKWAIESLVHRKVVMQHVYALKKKD